MTIPELAMVAHDTRTPPKARSQYRAEFHFRLVEVATMFLLPMLSLALAVPPKRSSSALGVFLSIVMLVTQHKINEYAASVAGLGKIDPVIALWVPFLIFAGLVWWMYRTLAYVPGGQPIGALERAAAKVSGTVMRWLRRLTGMRSVA